MGKLYKGTPGTVASGMVLVYETPINDIGVGGRKSEAAKVNGVSYAGGYITSIELLASLDKRYGELYKYNVFYKFA